MKQKRVLLISNAFFPEISPRSFRATELAKEFVRQGHQVVVYSKHRNFKYSDFLKEYPLDFHMWPKDSFPKIPQWKGRIGSPLSRALTRMLLLLFEYPGIEDMFKVKRLLKKETGYDLMISFAVPFPMHWGVAWARTVKHPITKTWVADCGDPYMGNTNDSFRKMPYFALLEKSFLRKADFITITKIEMKVNYYVQFHHKFREIPQGFDLSIREKLPEYKPNAIPTFAFSGSFITGHRDPDALLHYLSKLETNFKFVVFTKNIEFLNPYKGKLKEKLVIKDYVPRGILLKEIAQMDFLVNISYDPETQSPSKLIDYEIAGRPVLNIAKDIDYDAIDDFLDGKYDRKFKFGNIEKYDIRNVAKQFLELI